MPPGSTQYTLVGFSPQLDWKPVSFIKAIPPNRICGTCGLVRTKTAFLPCIHVVCESCYEQCAQDGLHVCPLDGYECQDEDVEWREWPAEELLRREVACWNRDCGCDTVIAAAEILHHFHSECGYHAVSCPKCSARILCSDVGSHLRSDCCSPVKCPKSGNHALVGYDDDKAHSTSFRTAFEKRVAEIGEVLQQVVVANASLGEKLNEISQSTNVLTEILEKELAAHAPTNEDILNKCISDLTAFNKEVEKTLTAQTGKINVLFGSIGSFQKTLTDEVANATSVSRDHLTQTAISIKAEFKEHNENVLGNIREVLRHVQLLVYMVNITVPGVQGLRVKALKDGWALYQSEKVYLRGYHVLPGIYVNKDGESLKVCPLMTLYKGDMDDSVQWPFQHKVRLSVVHPKSCSKRKCVGEPEPSDNHYHKPSRLRNTGVYFADNCLSLGDLLTGGYIENDRLCAQWELLP